jgi:hypothetical protein
MPLADLVHLPKRPLLFLNQQIAGLEAQEAFSNEMII